MHQNREWIKKAIIDLRKERNVNPNIFWCDWISDGCLEHSKYLTQIKRGDHTSDDYLLDKGECIGFTGSYSWSIEDKIREIIFGFDENHKRALLDYHVYGGDIALSQDPQLMHGLYLTLRYKL